MSGKIKDYTTEDTISGGIIYDFSERASKMSNPQSTITNPETGEVFYVEESNNVTTQIN